MMDEMKRRHFLQALGAGASTLAFPRLLTSCSSEIARPNIILIMADDMGYECLECNGGTSYETPYLNRLAATGVRFTDCYSQPLCTPSRVQMMTGKYNFRNYTEFGSLQPGERTFGHIMRDGGYRTCVAGKWQLAGRFEGANYRGEGTLPEDAGFHEHCLWQVRRLGSRYWNPVIQRDGEVLDEQADEYGPDLFCNYINDYIRRHRNEPFFIYYPMVLTHSPFVPTPRSDMAQAQRDSRDNRYFGEMVSYMDEIVGRIVQNLDDLGLRETTLILFTSDNGTPRNISSRSGTGIIQGAKGLTTDAGTHVPLIANWRGTSLDGEVCGDLVDFTDFLPTLADVAVIPFESEGVQDGRSFLPQIRGRRSNPRDWIFCHYDPRWGNWSLKRFARDKRWKLYHDGSFYDLGTDPLESVPLQHGQMSGEAVTAREHLQAVLDSMR